MKCLASLQALVLVGAAWCALATVVDARAYIDVPDDHWAAPAVRFASVEHHFMTPALDGSFRGDDPFTRAQLALALRRVLDALEAQSHTSWRVADTGPYAFEDVFADHEAHLAALDVANRYQVFQGVPGVFPTVLGAERRVTRYEMSICLDRVLHLGEDRGVLDPRVLSARSMYYKDVPSAGAAAPAVHELADRYQVIAGFPDGTFRGSEELTRYQFAAAVAQAFPLVGNLVKLTAERRAHRRFEEDLPLHVGLGIRGDGRGGAYATARALGYAGPVFGLLRGRLGVPIAAADALSDADLGLGLAWSPGASLAFQPYVAARGALTGGAGMLAGRGGLIIAWSPDPFELWLEAGATKPAGTLLNEAPGDLMGDGELGFGYALGAHLGLTASLGYAQLPTAPLQAGYTFGNESA